MTAQTHASFGNGKARVARPARTLDDLAKLAARELREIYEGGTVPESLDVLDGDLVGRMLAVRKLDHGGPLRGIAALSRATAFPWEGKSFRHDNETTGTGINRVKLPGGTRKMFPFATRVGPSIVDDRETIILDYDQPENPKAIRLIHDEIREVGGSAKRDAAEGNAPKLFLGPAALVRRFGRPTIVLWFALDAAR
ncbi:MAG TPA: hypothetical protein VGH87_23880 [Polyangiaceae bacterium]|jgi:hypothetical protein